MSNFRSWRQKYKTVHSNDKLNTLRTELNNLHIRQRNENDDDLQTRIDQLKTQIKNMEDKYARIAKEHS